MYISEAYSVLVPGAECIGTATSSYVSANTNRSASTSGHKRGTALRSSGGGTPDTLLRWVVFVAFVLCAKKYVCHGRCVQRIPVAKRVGNQIVINGVLSPCGM
jgi:hypothetical protein